MQIFLASFDETFIASGGWSGLIALLLVTLMGAIVVIVKPTPASRTMDEKTRHLVECLAMFAVGVSNAILFGYYGQVFPALAFSVFAAIFLGFAAQFIRVTAECSDSQFIRKLERIRSYIAGDEPSFEKREGKPPDDSR
ncbi:MAG TPA: hypothetical protein VK395_10570 [Gemmataceae bacterium]|nr:hypothetical protein [Gemmataceae bacterium]